MRKKKIIYAATKGLFLFSAASLADKQIITTFVPKE